MIAFITTILLAFLWLGYETDWMTVRLLVGKETARGKLSMTISEWERYDRIHYKELEQARKEYAKQQAYYKAHTCPLCKVRGAEIDIETKIIKVGNSTAVVSLCPDCLNKIEAQMVKAQKPTKPHDPYPISHYPIRYGISYGIEQHYGDIEIRVDGEVKLSLNGDYKRGAIKEALKPYITKARVGKRVVTWDFGEADRVVANKV